MEAANEEVVAGSKDDGTVVGCAHCGVVDLGQVGREESGGRRRGIVAPEFVPVSEGMKDASAYE